MRSSLLALLYEAPSLVGVKSSGSVSGCVYFCIQGRACHTRCVQIVLGSTKGILQQQTALHAPRERIQLL